LEVSLLISIPILQSFPADHSLSGLQNQILDQSQGPNPLFLQRGLLNQYRAFTSNSLFQVDGINETPPILKEGVVLRPQASFLFFGYFHATQLALWKNGLKPRPIIITFLVRAQG